MTGGFDGWLGPSPSGGGGSGAVVLVHSGVGINVDNTDPTNPIVNNTGVLTVTEGTGINVDNTDPQNPIVSLDTTTLPLCWSGTYYDFCIAADGHITVTQDPPSTGADSDANPAFLFRRHFTVNWPAYGLWGEYDTRYDQFTGADDKGGGQFYYYETDSTSTRRRVATHQVYIDRQISASGYDPALAPDTGSRTAFNNWFLTNRFDDASFLTWDADGVHIKDALFPNGGPYTLFSHQTNMWGQANISNAPEVDSELVFQAVAIGKHRGAGERRAFYNLFHLDDVTNEAGHVEWWVRSGAPAATLALSLYTDKMQFPAVTGALSAANTGALAYDGTLDRLQLSNNAGAYSSILTAADIGPTTGSIVTDIVSTEQDLETATTFTVVPNSAGRKFLPIAAYVEFTNVNTLATGPSLKLGNNGAHDNVAGVLAVANTAVTGSAPPFVMASDVAIIDLNATGIICELTVNAAATTCLGRIHVIGVYTT